MTTISSISLYIWTSILQNLMFHVSSPIDSSSFFFQSSVQCATIRDFVKFSAQRYPKSFRTWKQEFTCSARSSKTAFKRGWRNVGRCNVIKASTSRCLLLQEEVLWNCADPVSLAFLVHDWTRGVSWIDPSLTGTDAVVARVW